MARGTADDQIRSELEAIKRLLTLLLLAAGLSQKDIAKALGVDQSTISRLISSRNLPKGILTKSGEPQRKR